MSFITKTHLSRRTFLNGVGVTLALPLLESMIPAATVLGQTVAKPRTQRHSTARPSICTTKKQLEIR